MNHQITGDLVIHYLLLVPGLVRSLQMLHFLHLVVCMWCVRAFVFHYILKVYRIAAAFGVQPPIYLVKEEDNTVIFPNESSGRFISSCITPAATYNVHGTSTSNPTHATSFGAYPHAQFNRFPALQPPPPHPPAFIGRKKIIKKAVTLASLSFREQGSSTKNKIQYTTVTTVNISLDPTRGDCSIKAVCDKVKEQVGFEVILLDSKCYPLFASEETSDPDFWRSSRKVVAASKARFEKLGGVPTETTSTDLPKRMAEELLGTDHDDEGVTDLPILKGKGKGKMATREISEESKKRQVLVLSDTDEEAMEMPNVKKSKLVKEKSEDNDSRIDKMIIDVMKRLDCIDQRLGWLDDLKKALECCICQVTCKKPMVAPCCGRIIGCKLCIDCWATNNSNCPLCRKEIAGRVFQLKGFEEITSLCSRS